MLPSKPGSPLGPAEPEGPRTQYTGGMVLTSCFGFEMQFPGSPGVPGMPDEPRSPCKKTSFSNLVTFYLSKKNLANLIRSSYRLSLSSVVSMQCHRFVKKTTVNLLRSKQIDIDETRSTRVIHICALKFGHCTIERHPKNRIYRPKMLILVSDNYAHALQAEISPMDPKYHPNKFPKLKTQHFNIFVLLLKATNNNAENLKYIKHVDTSIVWQQFGMCLNLLLY